MKLKILRDFTILLRRFSPETIAALDSIMSSATMFAIQFSLLILSKKIEYGRFSLAMSYVVMGQALLSAIFGPPLITALSRLRDHQHRKVAAMTAIRWQIYGSAILGGSAAVACAAFVPGLTLELALFSALGLIGLAYRDVQRTTWTMEFRMWPALINTILFGAVAIFILCLTRIVKDHIDATDGILAIGIASVLTNSTRISRSLTFKGGISREFFRDMAGSALWSIPSVGLIWLQNNFYLTIVAAYLNLGAVAEVSAGRLIGLPYLLLSSGILRVAQVRFSNMIDNDDNIAIRKKLMKWITVHLTMGTLIASTLLAANFMMPNINPKRYPDLLILGACWSFFAGATASRSSVSALIQALGLYRTAFTVNFSAALVVLCLILILVPKSGVIGAVLPLCFGEIYLMVAFLYVLKRKRMI